MLEQHKTVTVIKATSNTPTPQILKKEVPWFFECFQLFFSQFFKGFYGVQRGQISLVFWVVFLCFCLNTKEDQGERETSP